MDKKARRIETLNALQTITTDMQFEWVPHDIKELKEFNILALLTLPGFFINNEGYGVTRQFCLTNHDLSISSYGSCIWLLIQDGSKQLKR